MIVDRYYFQNLTQNEQVIYRTIYTGVMEHRDFIPLPVKGGVSEEVLHKIFNAVTKDNPLVYFLNQSICSYATDSSGNVAFCPQYFYNADKVKDYNKKIEDTVNKLAEELHLTEGTDYEKEKKVHDWICRNIEYDHQGADLNKPARTIAAHNIIGVFAFHRAQCEGIAKAVKVLLNSVDVKCIVVAGEAEYKGHFYPHAWNMIKLGDKSYHLDVTWNIGNPNGNQNEISYEYFNVGDKVLKETHKYDVDLPKCKG